MSTPRERLASGLRRQADELDGTITLHAQVAGVDDRTLTDGHLSVSPSSAHQGGAFLAVRTAQAFRRPESGGVERHTLTTLSLDRERAAALALRLAELSGHRIGDVDAQRSHIIGAARALLRDAAQRFGIRHPDEFSCPYFRALAQAVVVQDATFLDRLGPTPVGPRPRGVAPEVSDAISSERVYQAHRWAPAEPGHPAQDADDRTLDEFALYVVGYAQDLLHQANHSGDHKATLDILRKIATLAVVAMERHGAPQRPGYEVGPR